MSAPVSYQCQDSIATIVMDDGKVNVLSPAMLAALNGAFDRAAAERAVVVLTGRQGVLSAGFDLNVLRADGAEADSMLRAGFEFAARMLSFATPVIVACNGHALAMGSFLLLCADFRIGTEGPYKIGANEVAIGLTMPLAAIEICRQRLLPAHFTRSVMCSEIYGPVDAWGAGFLDQVVTVDELQGTAQATAQRYVKLDMAAHAATKLRAREATLKAIRAGIEADAKLRMRRG